MIRPFYWALPLVLGAASLALGAAAQRLPPGNVVPKSLEVPLKGELREMIECDEEAVLRDGKVMVPSGATEVSEVTDVDEDRGPLSTLYPASDTSTDGFYPLPCEASIGGDLPPAALLPQSPGEVAAAEFVTAFENSPVTQGIIKGLGVIGGKLPKDLSALPPFTIGPCKIGVPAAPKEVPCDNQAFLTAGQPFEGRDIIYVHGLATDHLKKRLANYAPAKKKWPGDQGEFLSTGGYFRMYARDYWRGHITENLFNPAGSGSPGAGYEWTSSQASPTYNPKANRYLLVSWSTNQTLEYAQHTLLTQIMLAMTQNLNVVTPMKYPSQFRKPFCANGCIIITHSTGAEITSSAMARAARGDFGASAKLIPPRMRAHVSFAGAISGSRVASVGMALGAAGSPSGPAGAIVCAIEDILFETSNTCSLGTAFVAQSILRDLMPPVAQGIWGPVIAQSPVPTVTIAGGHPMGNYPAGVTKLVLPGNDDGVVSMNSACGNPIAVQPGALAPSGSTMTSNIKAFDLGVPVARAVKNFISQKDFQAGIPGIPYFAAGCTPYLSTTGMVMPVNDPMSQTSFDARRRYPNHFSFIQGAIDHSHDGGGDQTNPWPSLVGQGAGSARLYRPAFGNNSEEMSAITDGGIYAKAADGTHLVHPSFNGQMHEYVRGKKITFKLFKKKRTWWIWKRTYHLLHHWESKSSTHFAYEFVARR